MAFSQILSLLPIALFLALFPVSIFGNFGGPSSPQNDPFFTFFQGLSPRQRQQFIQISTNPDLTKPQAQQQINQFADRNGISDAYAAFNGSMNRIKARVEAAAEANLRGPALDTFDQLKKLLNDDSQTHGEVCAQVGSTLTNTDPAVVEFLPKGMLAACMGVGGDGMAAPPQQGDEEGGEGDEA